MVLLVHLNVFLMPAAGIILFSFVTHIVLRGLSNRFYVDSGKMDVFLTACCCALVPTPTSSNIRAHNLLQAHSVLTNLVLMASLSVCMFLSIDYSLPIINRPWQLRYSSNYFYNYCHHMNNKIINITGCVDWYIIQWNETSGHCTSEESPHYGPWSAHTPHLYTL